jgi:hypothetical protein
MSRVALLGIGVALGIVIGRLLPREASSPAPMFPLQGPPSEFVIVRHPDRTVSRHLRTDWAADTDEGRIVARTYAGRWGYFAPDAGPDDAPLAMHELAGPDGTILVGSTRLRFPTIRFPRRGDADAGVP